LNSEDIALIRNAKRGDIERFTEVVRHYKDFVYRTAFGVVQNNQDAEDVTQETFLKAHQSMNNLREERTFPSWIARIAVRSAFDLLEKNQRRKDSQDNLAVVMTLSKSHHESDLRIDIQWAMGKLTQDQRTIIVLRELHGFNYEEIAKILDIPIGTVRSRLHTARIQLKSLLNEEEGVNYGL
jgi:RNA polymerase sigma-70 factor, ECF subfamily